MGANFLSFLRYLLLCFILGIPLSLIAQTNNSSLFSYSESQINETWAAKAIGETRMTPVVLNDGLLDSLKNGQANQFTIITFDGSVDTIQVNRVMDQLDGDWSITGNINGDWRNSFILSSSGGQVLSEISNVTDDAFLELRYSDERSSHILIEFNPEEQDVIECSIEGDFKVGDSNSNQSFKIPQQADGTARIDVMIVYTPDAESWANSNKGGINNVINQAMAIAQNSVDNSNVDINFNLVHKTRVNFDESGDTQKDLRTLTDGNISGVHSLRDKYNADLVAMFARISDTGGYAWVLNSTRGQPDYAYSITRVQQAATVPTHAHEMGHNLGNAHGRDQSEYAAGDSGGLFEYSTGWRWTGDDGRGYVSVMTYAEGDARVQLFSNPNITYRGVPTGSYSGQYSPADNSRSMREIMHTVAGYRSENVDIDEPPTVTTTSISSITTSSAQSGGNVTDDGGSSVTDRGVCWDDDTNPNINDSCISKGTGTGQFSATMTNLAQDTRYYVRAYARNSEGLSYGNQRDFKTDRIPLDADESSVVASNTKVQANGKASSTITVTARDADRNLMRGVDITLRDSGGRSEINEIDETTNSDGEAFFEVTNQYAEEVTYRAEGTGVTISQRVTIEFVTVDANESSIASNQTEVEANGSATGRISVTARDKDGDELEDVRIRLEADRNGIQINAVNARTDEDGVASFYVSSETPGLVEFTATAIRDGGNVEINEKATIQFIPIAPVSLAATNVQEREFTANWELVDGAGLYLIDVSRDEEFDNILSGFDDQEVGNVTSFTVDPVSPGGTYWYRVKAQSDGLNGAYSDPIEVHTFPDVPVASNPSNVSATYFKANWQNAEGAQSYRLDVSRDSGFEDMLEDYNNRNVEDAQSFDITSLTTGTNYYYRVRAVAGPRTSQSSEVITATTLSVNADNSEIAASQLRVLADGNQANEIFVTVRSDEGQELENLKVEITPSGGSSSIEVIQGQTDDSGKAIFSVTNTVAETVTYTITAAGKEIGEVSVEFLENDGELALGNNFPNPFKNATSIPVTVPSPMQVNLTVYNTLGVPVRTVVDDELTTGYYEIPFETRELASGVYFYRLMTDEELKTGKMIFIN